MEKKDSNNKVVTSNVDIGRLVYYFDGNNEFVRPILYTTPRREDLAFDIINGVYYNIDDNPLNSSKNNGVSVIPSPGLDNFLKNLLLVSLSEKREIKRESFIMNDLEFKYWMLNKSSGKLKPTTIAKLIMNLSDKSIDYISKKTRTIPGNFDEIPCDVPLVNPSTIDLIKNSRKQGFGITENEKDMYDIDEYGHAIEKQESSSLEK